MQIGKKKYIIVQKLEHDSDYVNKVDPATVGQFTGLKDKNGKKVYGEDICRDGNEKVGVVKSFGGTRKMPNGFGGFEKFGLYEKTKDGWEHFKKTSFHNLVVIGNVYDNIELLGESV